MRSAGYALWRVHLQPNEIVTRIGAHNEHTITVTTGQRKLKKCFLNKFQVIFVISRLLLTTCENKVNFYSCIFAPIIWILHPEVIFYCDIWRFVCTCTFLFVFWVSLGCFLSMVALHSYGLNSRSKSFLLSSSRINLQSYNLLCDRFHTISIIYMDDQSMHSQHHYQDITGLEQIKTKLANSLMLDRTYLLKDPRVITIVNW